MNTRSPPCDKSLLGGLADHSPPDTVDVSKFQVGRMTYFSQHTYMVSPLCAKLCEFVIAKRFYFVDYNSFLCE